MDRETNFELVIAYSLIGEQAERIRELEKMVSGLLDGIEAAKDMLDGGIAYLGNDTYGKQVKKQGE